MLLYTLLRFLNYLYFVPVSLSFYLFPHLSIHLSLSLFLYHLLIIYLCTQTYQAPLSMEFSQQECWSGVPFPPPGDLPEPGIEPASLNISCISRQILYHQCNLESPISFTQIHQLFIFAPISLSFYLSIYPSTCPSIRHLSLFLFLCHLSIICLHTHTHTHTCVHTVGQGERFPPEPSN